MARKPRIPQTQKPEANAVVSSGDDAAGVRGRRTMDAVTGEVAADQATPGLAQGALRNGAVDPVSFDVGPVGHGDDGRVSIAPLPSPHPAPDAPANDLDEVTFGVAGDEPHPPMSSVISEQQRASIIDGGINNVAAGDVDGDGVIRDTDIVGSNDVIRDTDVVHGDGSSSFEEVSIGVAAGDVSGDGVAMDADGDFIVSDGESYPVVDDGSDEFLKIEGLAEDLLDKAGTGPSDELAANQAEVAPDSGGVDPDAVPDTQSGDGLIIVVCDTDPTDDDITAEDDWEDAPGA